MKRQMKTSVYQFLYKGKKRGSIEGRLITAYLIASTRDFDRYELQKYHKWDYEQIQFEINHERNSMTIHKPKEQITSVTPVTCWTSIDNVQYLGTYFFGVYPVIVEFTNCNSFRVYHNDAYTMINDFIYAFRYEMSYLQQSVYIARIKMDVIMLLDHKPSLRKILA